MEIKAWDEAMALIIEELKATGQLDNAHAISGDHGAPGFPRQMQSRSALGFHSLLPAPV